MCIINVYENFAYMYISALCTWLVPEEARRGRASGPLSCSYSKLQVALWELGIEPRSCEEEPLSH